MWRKSLIFLLVLLLAASSLLAFPGRVTGSQEARPIDTLAQEALAEGPKTGSGTLQKDTSAEPSASYLAQEKAEQGKRLTSAEVDLIISELEEAMADVSALREASDEKDEVISSLARENEALRDETGTKAYLMLNGLMGFKDKVPQFGVGLTVGTRIGNDLMVELGADYMIGGMDGLNAFSLDSFQFEVGVGWMF